MISQLKEVYDGITYKIEKFRGCLFESFYACYVLAIGEVFNPDEHEKDDNTNPEFKMRGKIV